jgi:NAD(P)-dependent dehydrogenase (short-subunit alcohol dehydrogenase family)
VGKAAYVAAKHGVIGLTKVVGLETATSNVTCNAICPGWVLTPLVQKQIDDRAANGVDPQQAQHDLLAEKQPSLEFVTPPQLGNWCCSCAARLAARCAARRGTLMVVGSRASPCGEELPAGALWRADREQALATNAAADLCA